MWGKAAQTTARPLSPCGLFRSCLALLGRGTRLGRWVSSKGGARKRFLLRALDTPHLSMHGETAQLDNVRRTTPRADASWHALSPQLGCGRALVGRRPLRGRRGVKMVFRRSRDSLLRDTIWTPKTANQTRTSVGGAFLSSHAHRGGTPTWTELVTPTCIILRRLGCGRSSHTWESSISHWL